MENKEINLTQSLFTFDIENNEQIYIGKWNMLIFEHGKGREKKRYCDGKENICSS